MPFAAASVVLTTTGGGAEGPSGPLLKPITDTFPDVEIVNRMGNLNAMDDPRFANAVKATGRRKIILSGITTDFCLVYPALSLLAAGYHVFIAVDASGSWTKEINDWALQRLIQAGATPRPRWLDLGERAGNGRWTFHRERMELLAQTGLVKKPRRREQALPMTSRERA